jgi:hypothetical protein
MHHFCCYPLGTSQLQLFITLVIDLIAVGGQTDTQLAKFHSAPNSRAGNRVPVDASLGVTPETSTVSTIQASALPSYYNNTVRTLILRGCNLDSNDEHGFFIIPAGFADIHNN